MMMRRGYFFRTRGSSLTFRWADTSKRLTFVFLLAALTTGVLSFPCAAGEWSLNGYFKSLDLRIQDSPLDSFTDGSSSANRFRLDLAGSHSHDLRSEFSVEALALLTSPRGIVPLPTSSPNRLLDLENDWNRSDSPSGRVVVDRLNLQGRFAGWDWALGRQAVGFGRITLFSPLDVIAPFPPDALDTEVRPGVDSVRLVRYFGLGGQAGLAVVLDDKKKNGSFLGTFSWHLGKWDVLLLTGSLRQRAMLGIGFAGEIGGLGIKAEAAFYDGKEVGKPGGDLHRDFTIAGLEFWHRFPGDLVLLAEYLYNGAGVDDAEDYPQAAASAPFREGLSYLFGRHYLIVGPSFELHPLVTLQGLIIWNLEDMSSLIRPLADISLTDNLAFQLFWNFAAGKKPDRVFGIPVLRSEFGSVPDSGGMLLKFYF